MLNMMLITSSLILAFTFTQMNHPLAMGLLLLLQTLVMCLVTGFTTQSFWFSYILFLVFLGGLLVLFIYVASLASNEMFSLSTITMTFMTIAFGISWFLFIILDPYFLMNTIESTDMLHIDSTFYSEETAFSLMKLYNNPTSLVTLMLVSYLFLTLIAVVKITKISSGPLRLSN
uniref:NADH-ubiquinone oxidoreductase chain 6 n=1 Tax=Agnetina aequalis TaxID=2021290 RepID=A0A678RTQ1_9NEOP|nr:NADH dehydrogenase subunit 6 [Agnetina aequalis]